ncbi:hypothetical protein B0H10DRAFT_1941896 [Mycena sp. CBHHK59/15]|nr:hypothetical protein B0H10DRAFT_1941896 [Mycena sp. CBHHK59/15]
MQRLHFLVLPQLAREPDCERMAHEKSAAFTPPGHPRRMSEAQRSNAEHDSFVLDAVLVAMREGNVPNSSNDDVLKQARGEIVFGFRKYRSSTSRRHLSRTMIIHVGKAYRVTRMEQVSSDATIITYGLKIFKLEREEDKWDNRESRGLSDISDSVTSPKIFASDNLNMQSQISGAKEIISFTEKMAVSELCHYTKSEFAEGPIMRRFLASTDQSLGSAKASLNAVVVLVE